MYCRVRSTFVCLMIAACVGGMLAAAGEALSGGDGTVFDTTRNAFSLPARNLPEARRPQFFVGNSFFNQNWIAAPASVAARDGLGPLFNARSCSGCHFKDGRGQPPAAGEPMDTMLVRISVPGEGPHGGPKRHPVYGDQIQGQSIPGVRREADVFVTYEEVAGRFGDGEPFSLRRPAYRIANLGYGELDRPLLLSPRVSPAIVGLGLLEAIPAAALERSADPDDRDSDGISGRVNIVWDAVREGMAIGRFGWKAEQPTVLQQTAAAFAGDIGITTSLFPRDDRSELEPAGAAARAHAGPEASAQVLHAVALYARSLAVPAARTDGDARAVGGRELFAVARCSACHTPTARTGDYPDQPELANQTIRPFTDLLLHEMGSELADRRPSFAASGSEWRTPPLWGVGLVGKVNGHTFLLHDGRARNVSEAILWHGGEAAASRERFRTMPAQDRAALIAFVNSL